MLDIMGIINRLVSTIIASLYSTNELSHIDPPLWVLLVFLFGPFIVFACFLRLINRFGVPIRPLRLWGENVRRIPHYLNDIEQGKKINNGGRESIAKKWRIMMINFLRKKKGKGPDDILRFIFGECSDTMTIEHALASGFTVELLCGPEFRDENSKNRLAYLKGKYNAKLSIIQLDERPKQHGVKIGKNILLEDIHEEHKEYAEATVIEGASDIVVRRFDQYFDKLRNEHKLQELTTKEAIMKSKTMSAIDYE